MQSGVGSPLAVDRLASDEKVRRKRRPYARFGGRGVRSYSDVQRSGSGRFHFVDFVFFVGLTIDADSVAVVPRLIPFVVGEGEGRGALLDQADQLLGDARPGEKAAGLVGAHARETMGEAGMLQDFDDGNAEVLFI